MESKHQQSWQDAQTEGDALDQALDAALAKYAAVEPRPGLEGRILAHLHSEQKRSPMGSWWRWSAAAMVVVLIVVVAALGWRLNRPTRMGAQPRPSAPIERVAPSATQVALNGNMQSTAIRPRRKARQHVDERAADEPKLDQFPSPEPLTREEMALVRYVKEFPRDAVTVASAQEEFEKEIQIEEAAGRQATSNSSGEER